MEHAIKKVIHIVIVVRVDIVHPVAVWYLQQVRLKYVVVERRVEHAIKKDIHIAIVVRAVRVLLAQMDTQVRSLKLVPVEQHQELVMSAVTQAISTLVAEQGIVEEAELLVIVSINLVVVQADMLGMVVAVPRLQ